MCECIFCNLPIESNGIDNGHGMMHVECDAEFNEELDYLDPEWDAGDKYLESLPDMADYWEG